MPHQTAGVPHRVGQLPQRQPVRNRVDPRREVPTVVKKASTALRSSGNAACSRSRKASTPFGTENVMSGNSSVNIASGSCSWKMMSIPSGCSSARG